MLNNKYLFKASISQLWTNNCYMLFLMNVLECVIFWCVQNSHSERKECSRLSERWITYSIVHNIRHNTALPDPEIDWFLSKKNYICNLSFPHKCIVVTLAMDGKKTRVHRISSTFLFLDWKIVTVWRVVGGVMVLSFPSSKSDSRCIKVKEPESEWTQHSTLDKLVSVWHFLLI